MRLLLAAPLGLVAIAIAADQSSVVARVVVLIAAGVLVARCARIGVQFDNDAVVVRNVFSTRKIPRIDIDQFIVETTVTHGGPTLVIRTSSGRCAVTAYPITRIPAIAQRRAHAVVELNEWLKHAP